MRPGSSPQPRRHPAMPTCRRRLGRRFRTADAVEAAASTGPIPHVIRGMPSAPRSSASVAATTRGITGRTVLGAPRDSAQPATFTWPRISPLPFFAVWTFTYAPPDFSAAITSFEIVAVPDCPLLHGPQSGTITGPAVPGLPLWMWAAAAGPLSPEKLSFHFSVAPFALVT